MHTHTTHASLFLYRDNLSMETVGRGKRGGWWSGAVGAWISVVEVAQTTSHFTCRIN